MFETKPSIESTASAVSSGLNSDLSWGLVWIGLTLSDKWTSTFRPALRSLPYFSSAQALLASNRLATIASFNLDIAVPFSPAGLQHSGETRASVEVITMTHRSANA